MFDFLYKMFSFRILYLFLFSSYGFGQTFDALKANLHERPQFDGVMGKYLNYPGLEYEPNLKSVRGLIKFNKGDASTYGIYVDQLDLMLTKYHDEYYPELQIDCSAISGFRHVDDLNHYCGLDIRELGADCVKQNNYGYEYGQPCIALYLDRILNWLPEAYTNETVPDKIRASRDWAGNWTEYAITVQCEGEDPVTKDNMGTIFYYPAEGFWFKYFPHSGLDGWQNPLVFIRLYNPIPAIALRITCSVYAKNIKHDDIFQTGKVSFDVMVD